MQYHLHRKRGLSCNLLEGVSIKGILGSDNSLEAFFGYYDKSPWSFDDKYYLLHILDRRHKDKVKIAVYNCESGEVECIDESPAFNVQQGAMLRWLDRESYRCIYNTVEDKNLVAKIRDAVSGEEIKTIPMPIQTINFEGTEALTLNYKRLDKMRPEYGYGINVKNFSGEMPYEEDGIWKINLETMNSEIIVNLARLISLNHNKTMDKSQHKINHIMYSPSGKKFSFMHRWVGPYGRFHRLYTANADGSKLYCLFDELVSHCFWLDDEHLIAWGIKEPLGGKYFLLKDISNDFEIVGAGVLDIYGDGHPHVHPSKEWIVTDTYPNKAWCRELLLYNLKTNKLFVVGTFLSSWKYTGAYRCDLHPRWSSAGTKISIDSVHEGYRNSYIIDIPKFLIE
jgi:hypothetical protein